MDRIPLPVLVTIGRVIADGRAIFGWSQRELARRSGISQGRISRIERSRAPDVTLATIDRLCVVLAVRYDVRFELPRAERPQRDIVHARMVGSVDRRLESAGWQLDAEVQVGTGRAIGWIDTLAFEPALELLLIAEMKSEIDDVGAVDRQVAWYEREALAAAVPRGWQPSRVVSVVFLLETTTNDDRVQMNAAALRRAFPGRAVDLREVLAGRESPHRRFLVMIDPRSRAREWVRPTRSEHRNRPARYVDYIDAARRLSVRRRSA